jgi:hypothetical protein
MGNTPSTNETFKFGSIYGKVGKDGKVEKVRPGYYFGKMIMYKGQQIPIMENETDFQKLKFGYAKSNTRVFYNGKPIHANPATFLVFTRNNVKTLSKFPDKNEEFFKLNSVLGMDFLGNKKRIFFRDRVIHEE